MSIASFSTDTLKNTEDLIFGERISYIIENRGLSKAWIAERLGISKQALNYLLKHATKPKFLDELADLLQLNPKWLETGEGSPWLANTESRVANLANKIKIRTKHELLHPQEAPKAEQDFIDYSGSDVHQVIAYKLNDNSNFPPFIQGSILIFNRERKPGNGDYVLAIIENDVFVRQYLIDGKISCYKASSGDHKTFINPVAMILGVLFEARYKIN